MAVVDPPLFPIPRKLLDDPELSSYFRAVQQFQHDLWKRTGGGEDKIENVEATQVTEDGGNRSTRFIVDDLQAIQSQIDSIKRSVRAVNTEIEEIKSEPREINKTENSYEDHHHVTKNTFYSEVQIIKRQNRALEQKINELEERIDNGT